MKKGEFELADSLHRNWLDYKKKHNINEDIAVLQDLLNGSSHISRTEQEILDALYDAALAVLESTPQLNTEQKTRALYFSYNLCSCEACQQECGAHINKKGQIRISKKFFLSTLNQMPSPIGLLELTYTILHEILQGIFPELEKEANIEKTEQVWRSGMTKLVKEN